MAAGSSEIALAVREAGGRALLAGGRVRDQAMHELLGTPLPEARDLDLEVFGIDGAALRSLLERFGPVNAVGEAFTVYKLGDIDVSLPRRDSKTGRGHRGFSVEGDPSMTVEEASRRRDFTINAMLQDPLTGELLDPFRGRADILARTLRVVDPATFGDDSLRVLRAMQFAARFEFSIDPATAALCRAIPLDDLPAERVWGEMEKLLLRARRPSLGLAAGLETGAIDRLFPELGSLVGCGQEPDTHPEGDVWVHTLQAVDIAAADLEGLDRARRLAVMLAVLCHDLGKPASREVIEGRVRFLGHEEAGLDPTQRFLDRLKVHTFDGYDARARIRELVACHLSPSQLHRERDRVSDAAFRRLSRRCDLDLLCRVARADLLGRRPKEPDDAAVTWFRGRAEKLGVLHRPPPPILMGRHVIELGMAPGPRVGVIVDAVYELQLDGAVTSLVEALSAARRLLSSP